MWFREIEVSCSHPVSGISEGLRLETSQELMHSKYMLFKDICQNTGIGAALPAPET